jgi:hypothetical protein
MVLHLHAKSISEPGILTHDALIMHERSCSVNTKIINQNQIYQLLPTFPQVGASFH